MSLMSENELEACCQDVRDLIVASGISAEVLRPSGQERLYGTDDEGFTLVFEMIIELKEEPKEELSGKIDATASVLPDSGIQVEDLLRIGTRRFRVQTVEPAYFFGTRTHLTLNLVEIHGS